MLFYFFSFFCAVEKSLIMNDQMQYYYKSKESHAFQFSYTSF